MSESSSPEQPSSTTPGETSRGLQLELLKAAKIENARLWAEHIRLQEINIILQEELSKLQEEEGILTAETDNLQTDKSAITADKATMTEVDKNQDGGEREVE